MAPRSKLVKDGEASSELLQVKSWAFFHFQGRCLLIFMMHGNCTWHKAYSGTLTQLLPPGSKECIVMRWSPFSSKGSTAPLEGISQEHQGRLSVGINPISDFEKVLARKEMGDKVFQGARRRDHVLEHAKHYQGARSTEWEGGQAQIWKGDICPM